MYRVSPQGIGTVTRDVHSCETVASSWQRTDPTPYLPWIRAIIHASPGWFWRWQATTSSTFSRTRLTSASLLRNVRQGMRELTLRWLSTSRSAAPSGFIDATTGEHHGVAPATVMHQIVEQGSELLEAYSIHDLPGHSFGTHQSGSFQCGYMESDLGRRGIHHLADCPGRFTLLPLCHQMPDNSESCFMR